MERDDDALNRLSESITDETRVDWVEEESRHPEESGRFAGLRLIERIADVHRAAAQGDGEDRVLFAWGHLKVLEKIGEGSFGDIYRAHDPLLRRDVALKLLREERARSPALARSFLDEAARMARVRHPNVLTIHGADTHDGRVGFWTDLLQGESLEEAVSSGRRLGANEAAALGLEICRALAAVHAAGIVHGDVKATNVMRSSEGRFVLVDFGAGSDLTSTGAEPAIGTPLVLAPEVLRGEPAGPASDLYSLGVLLYRLVSGKYPAEASDSVALAEMHRRGQRVPLRDLRPDLPEDFVCVVERALAGDLAHRFSTAGQMEAALAGTMARPRKATVGWAAALAAAVALAVVLIFARARREPAAVFDVDATLYRVQRAVPEALQQGALLHPGDQLFLELQPTSSSYVYVLNEDEQGDVFVLFPLGDLEPANPLAGGRKHRLPGARADTPIHWQVTSGRGRESFLFIASREPLGELESQLATFARASAGRAVEYARLDPAMPTDTRGVAGLVQGEASTGTEEEGVLAKIARRVVEEAASGRIWVKQLTAYNLGS